MVRFEGDEQGLITLEKSESAKGRRYHSSSLTGDAQFRSAALVKRARQSGVELSIAEAMADLIGGVLPLGEALTRLMSRRLKAE